MKRHNIALGRVLGIPIGLDSSWFLIFALLTWILASSYYPAQFPDWSPPRLEWATTQAEQVMLPLERLKRIVPEAELWSALQERDRDDVNQLPVTRVNRSSAC